MRWLLRRSARCSQLMTLSAALRPAPPLCTAQSTARPVQNPEPCTSSATPNALPSAASCALLCPSLPCAPARALHSLATTSTAPLPCTVSTHAWPCAVLPRGALLLWPPAPAPPSSSSDFGVAPSLRWPLGLQWRLLFAKSLQLPSTESLWNKMARDWNFLKIQ